MSATYGWLRGYSRSGNPKQKNPATACGPASIWAKVGTWRTSVEATVEADGSGQVTIRRGAAVIFAASFERQDGTTANIVTIGVGSGRGVEVSRR